MKYARFAVLALLAVSFATAGMPEGNAAVNWEKAEQNYVAALKTDNAGLQISAASFIRKYNLTGAVDELKKLLTKGYTDNVKISAAMALIKIGGDEGRKAVEEALENEESELVAEFYRTMLHAQITAQN
jgi:HEAT repeat protein